MDTNQKDPAAKNVLNRLRDVSSLTDKLLASEKECKRSVNVQLVKEINQHLKNPNWLIKTKNNIVGQLSNSVYDVEVEINFEIDTKGLLSVIEKLKSKKKDITIKDLGVYSQEINEILSESLLPKTIGISRSIRINKAYGDKLDEDKMKDIVGWVDISYENNIVWIDYAELLSNVMNRLFLFDRNLFKSHLKINDELLRGSDQFQNSFSWKDKELSISIKLELIPIQPDDQKA